MHRTATRATPFALLAVLALLAGCSEDAVRGPAAPSASPTVSATPSPTAAAVRDLAQRGIDAGPYSSRIVLRTYGGGVEVASMEGKINLNGPMTGKVRVTSREGERPLRVDVVMTGKQVWARSVDEGGPWRRANAQQLGMTDEVAVYGRYVLALLESGDEAEVIKGRERTESGATALRLSGEITADAVRSIDPNVYDTMRSLGVDTFECDVWLDDEGRPVQFEQWLRAKDVVVHNLVRFEDFGAAFTQPAPGAKKKPDTGTA